MTTYAFQADNDMIHYIEFPNLRRAEIHDKNSNLKLLASVSSACANAHFRNHPDKCLRVPTPTSEPYIGIRGGMRPPEMLADKDILAVLDFCAGELKHSTDDGHFDDGHIKMVRKVDTTIRRLSREAGYILPEGTE